MGMAQGFKELVVWQLAEQLRRKIIKMTSAAKVKKDVRFVSDIRGSSRSVAANIAEGHGRFTPVNFTGSWSSPAGRLKKRKTIFKTGSRACISRKRITPRRIYWFAD
jgi:hypothetical protein